MLFQQSKTDLYEGFNYSIKMVASTEKINPKIEESYYPITICSDSQISLIASLKLFRLKVVELYSK